MNYYYPLVIIFLLLGGGEGDKFLGGDIAGEGDEGGGVLKVRNPSNPSDLLYSLLLLDGGCCGCE